MRTHNAAPAARTQPIILKGKLSDKAAAVDCSQFCSAGDLPGCIEQINHFQTLAKDKSRLGIPLSFSEETLRESATKWLPLGLSGLRLLASR